MDVTMSKGGAVLCEGIGEDEEKPVEPVRPRIAKMVQVVSGLAEWTEEESAWIMEHPEVIEFQRRLALALDRAEQESTQTDYASTGAAGVR